VFLRTLYILFPLFSLDLRKRTFNLPGFKDFVHPLHPVLIGLETEDIHLINVRQRKYI